MGYLLGVIEGADDGLLEGSEDSSIVDTNEGKYDCSKVVDDDGWIDGRIDGLELGSMLSTSITGFLVTESDGI